MPNNQFLATLPATEKTEFLAWMEALDKHADAAKAYGTPLAETTGLECWHVYFEDGYSPEDALAEDLSYD